MTVSLRPMLPRTFGAFLGRFDRPTDIQRNAIPAILEGGDVLLCAPTAGGKTEAYGAPCAELLLASPREDDLPEWLLVSPTRALANDLHRRLSGRMEQLHLPLGRYTGEHKERGKNVWPKALIVTPESLDSLLARRPHVLAHVRRVVVDEVHVLDGTVRGDQLRILLHRLQAACEGPLQRIAASATVAHTSEVAERYLIDATICEAHGDRKVKAKSFAGTTAKAMAGHLDVLAGGGLRKVLIFVPSRRDVDDLSHKLKNKTRFGPMVFAHHGSLSQAIRERTERQFHDAPAAVAVATHTLELGIDIGSVDYVLLSSPPSSVASLMQRIGRGGRRAGTIRFGYAWRDSGEEFRFKVMARAGVRGLWLGEPYGFRASVIAQQALVVAGGFGYVNAQRLQKILPPDLLELVTLADLHGILQKMADTDVLEASRDARYVLSEASQQRYDRGSVHSNLSDPGGRDVVDRLTGDVVGRISKASEGSSQVSMGGRGRRVIQDGQDRVLTDAGGAGKSVAYVTHGSPLTSMELGRECAVALGATQQGLQPVSAESGFRLIHGLGTVGALFLATHLTDLGVIIYGKPTPVSLQMLNLPDPWVAPDEASLLAFLRQHKGKLQRLASLGPFHNVLPPDLAEHTLRAASGLDQVLDFLKHAAWAETIDADDVDPALLHV